MPEFTLKEVRLPELHLPEIKRDDIARSLSGVRLPDVDLTRARAAKIKVPAVTLTGADVGRLVAAGAAVARLVRPAPRRSRLFRLGRSARTPSIRLLQPRKRRSRWPLLIVVAGGVAVAIWAVLRQPAVRERVDSMARDVRERIATMQAPIEELNVDSDKPIALRGVDMGSTDLDTTVADADAVDTGSTTGDGIPAFEEAGKPV
jgi:hypothetical protein